MNFATNIHNLRSRSGLSQDDIARALNITRPAYKQLETNEREPSIAELKNISELFGQRTEDLISKNMILQDESENDSFADGLNKMKYRNLTLYLVQKVGARPNVGETVLYKLLYFIETLSYSKKRDSITDEKFIKMQYGPVPVSFRALTDEMVNNNELDKVKGRYFTYMQTKYLPRISSTGLTAEEQAITDKVIDTLGDMTATELSDLSHRDEPWKRAQEGKIVDLSLIEFTSLEHAAKMGRAD